MKVALRIVFVLSMFKVKVITPIFIYLVHENPFHGSGAKVIRYCDTGEVEKAIEAFKGKPDSSGATRLISNFMAQKKDIGLAFEVYQTLLQHSTPNNFVFRTLIAACRRSGNSPRAISLWKDFQQYSIPLDEITFGLFISICNDTKNLQLAQGLASIWQKGLSFKPSIKCCTQLISVLTKNSDLQSALASFDAYRRFSEPDIILFNTIMSTCITCKQPSKIFHLFNLMDSYAITPNNHTYGILILACSETGNAEMAKILFKKVQDRLIQVSEIDCNQLIKAFVSKGCLTEAFEVELILISTLK